MENINIDDLTVNIDGLNHKGMQELAKKWGINAGGTKAQLRKNLKRNQTMAKKQKNKPVDEPVDVQNEPVAAPAAKENAEKEAVELAAEQNAEKEGILKSEEAKVENVPVVQNVSAAAPEGVDVQTENVSAAVPEAVDVQTEKETEENFEREATNEENDWADRKPKASKSGKNNVTSRAKLTSLQLKKPFLDLFKDSQFFKLLNIANSSQSSATLMHALSGLYDSESMMFVLNEEVYFTFCACEVANVLGIRSTGKRRNEISPKEKVSSLPPFVEELKKIIKANGRGKGKEIEKQEGKGKGKEKEAKRKGKGKEKKISLTARELKTILKDMNPSDDKSKKECKQLLRYYLLDQFLLPNSDNFCATNLYKFVNDEVFEDINWAQEVWEHIVDAIGKVQQGNKLFVGCSPALEAMIDRKLPNLKDLKEQVQQSSSLPVDTVKFKKNSIAEWTNALQTQREMFHCPSCPSLKKPLHVKKPSLMVNRTLEFSLSSQLSQTLSNIDGSAILNHSTEFAKKSGPGLVSDFLCLNQIEEILKNILGKHDANSWELIKALTSYDVGETSKKDDMSLISINDSDGDDFDDDDDVSDDESNYEIKGKRRRTNFRI